MSLCSKFKAWLLSESSDSLNVLVAQINGLLDLFGKISLQVVCDI